MGKSSLIQRTLEKAKVPILRLSYHEVVDMADLIMRTVTEFERFLHNRRYQIQGLIPAMRLPEVYRNRVHHLLPAFPIEPLLGSGPS